MVHNFLKNNDSLYLSKNKTFSIKYKICSPNIFFISFWFCFTKHNIPTLYNFILQSWSQDSRLICEFNVFVVMANRTTNYSVDRTLTKLFANFMNYSRTFFFGSFVGVRPPVQIILNDLRIISDFFLIYEILTSPHQARIINLSLCYEFEFMNNW